MASWSTSINNALKQTVKDQIWPVFTVGAAITGAKDGYKVGVEAYNINKANAHKAAVGVGASQALIGLLVNINRTIIDTIKYSIIVTFEWIGPEGTYYITDKYLPVDFFQGSSTIKHGLRIDSNTMQTGKWIVRILVNNILNFQFNFYIQSVTYKNPYNSKGY